MARSLSLYRRKPNLVDILIRKRPGVTGFRFGAAANFDSTFDTFAVVPNHGLKSPSVPNGLVANVGSQFRDLVRFVFDPADYVATAPALIDTNQFFLRVEERDAAGAFGATEAMHLILPPAVEPRKSFTLRGTVPVAADLDNALEIQLPSQCNDFEILNDGGTNAMYIAFHPSGGEHLLDNVNSIFEQQLTSITQIFIRSDTTATTSSMTFTLRNDLGL